MKSAPQPSVDAAPILDAADEASTGFERECVDFFAEVVAVFGAPPSVGQIYGMVFASSRPLSFTDIVERLEMSKGSVSQGLQLLRSLGAVHSVNATDDRREYFVPELGLRRLVGGALRERIGPLVAASPERFARLRRLARQEGATKIFCLGRVEQLETWRNKLKLALPLLNALLGPKRGR
jgi:DNA-binding transcriptional regulator GbsR (MarR family)